VTSTIGLLGDVMLGRGVARALQTTPPAELWARELREIATGCDLVVCNLECCISDRGRPTDLVPGKPFFFRAPPIAVESLEAIGVDAVSLANNHALDFGPEALEDTLHHLAEAGIAAVGAGYGVEQARRGVLVTRGDLCLAIVAVSDHPREFAAGPNRWGVAYADLAREGLPDWLRSEIRRLREQCDLVLAFPHWGPNMSDCPAPWQRRLAAELLEAGADMVAGHSAHVFHGVERVGAKLVAYDIGDAIDDYAIDERLRIDLGVMALWSPHRESPGLELVGLWLDYCHTRLATGAEAGWIADRLGRACAELGTAVERVGEQRFRVP
jgi:poly-gamma-glutamate capsule biosynthesis protein CapA/YwtB (metallophosphatase superfamily)